MKEKEDLLKENYNKLKQLLLEICLKLPSKVIYKCKNYGR
jgi:hypothetical protein